MLIENIDSRRIDTGDLLYQLERPDDTPLDWDTTQPLFNPIWLQRKQQDAFRIVDGFRVVRAVVSGDGAVAIPARIFPENSNLLELWEQRVQKRGHEKNLSLFSWIESLSRIMAALPLEIYQPGANRGYLPPGMRTGPINRREVEQILEKSISFGSFTQIHQLEYQQLKTLTGYNSNELAHIGTLLGGLQLKGNKLSSLLELIQELYRGYGINSEQLLADEVLADIRSQFQPHQRYRHIKARLLELRYPRLSQLQFDWEKAVKQAGLQAAADILHDPYFEDEYLQFVIRAHSIENLRERLQVLLTAADSPGLKRLFEFI